MTPRLAPGCLITVLGAQERRSHSLLQALHARLDGRELGTEVLPLCQSPGALASSTDWIVEQQHALNAALSRSIVLSAGSLPRMAAQADGSASAVLIAAAQAQYARSALVLLCALDAQATDAERHLDAQLRAHLQTARASFAVVHGDGAAAFAQAWQSLCLTVDRQLDAAELTQERRSAAWQWSCDKCSDPACEHRMFSDLVARREKD